jgi:hypothetical protein
MKSLRREWILVLILGIVLSFFSIPLTPTQGADASLYISPTTGRRFVGETFQLVVRVNTGGQAINAAEGSIVFNPQKVEVTSISKGGSIFNLWTGEPTFSNAEGTIEFSGGLPSPGYTGSSGLLFTITFRGKSATTISNSTNIALVSGAILANDGYGTNILTSLGKSSFFIAPIGAEATESSEEETPQPAPAGLTRPELSSKTHPDQSKWYSDRIPIISWTLPSRVTEVRLGLSQRASGVPFVVYRPPISEKKLDPLDDGIWYLNAKYFAPGLESPVGGFKIQIDATAPQDFAVLHQNTEDRTDPRPEILFATSDGMSGIDHFELTINGQKITVDANAGRSVYTLPLQKPGKKEISVKAVDKAGNTSTASTILAVDPLEKPVIEDVTEQVEGGEALTVKGTAPEELKVVVEILDRNVFGAKITAARNPVTQSQTVTPKADGTWEAVFDNLPSGAYLVRAHSQDDREAISEDTETVAVRVGSAFWSAVGTAVSRVFNNLPSATILLLSLLCFLVLVLGWLIVEHFRQEGFPGFGLLPLLKMKIKKTPALRKEEGAMLGKLDKLSRDIEDELKLLKRVSGHRQLYPEEKYLRDKLNQYRKTLKLFDSKK